ncbi:MAG TPA: hypothetical protein PKD85_00950 [Saprospiraceae bacterium]|nr:hypothetical protein [Saprospiraceae bacterium]
MMRNFGQCIPNPTILIERPFNKLPIYSINYDYVPTIPNRYTALWVDVKFDPKDFNTEVGDIVWIESATKDFVPPPQQLKIIDIVGTRIVLKPLEPSFSTQPIYPFQAKNDLPTNIWNPRDHGGHWGYATRNLQSLPWKDENWLFGNGRPIAYMLW